MLQTIEPPPPQAMIAALHQDHGLSLAEISERLGVTRVAVWNWYAGKSQPRVQTQAKITALFGEISGGARSGEQPSFREVISEAKEKIAEALDVPPDAVTITINH